MSREIFLKIYKDADDNAHDDSEADPFPAYLDGIDTTLAPFCPTSARRVLKALDMAGVCASDRLLDLGSGDGRFCAAAVSVFNSEKAVGVETDEALIALSHSLADQTVSKELQSRLEFIHGDLLALPSCVKDAFWSVVVVFLLPDHTDKFAEYLLQQYKRGARIVSLVFNLSEIKELELVASNEPEGIYVYSKTTNTE